MRVSIVAVGRLKAGPERELFTRYWDRLEALGRKQGLGPLHVRELAESRAATAAARMDEEARRLLEVAAGARIVMLDARGKGQTSEAFAAELRRARDGGVEAIAFLIGGADGHGEAVRAAASQTLSLGAMTLPHGLARVVLAEQLYRAATIIAGHPYHRA